MGGQPVLVSRTGWTGEMGFEFYTLPEEAPVDGEALWHHVEAAGKPFGMTVCGLDSMDIRRIEAGILNNVSDMDETMNPYQAGLGSLRRHAEARFHRQGRHSVDADKGILLHGLQCDAGEPYIDGDVMSGDEIIGRVTAAAWSPLLKCGTAIIRLTDAGHVNAAVRDGAHAGWKSQCGPDRRAADV